MSPMRIGQGIDVHRFGGDGPLMLCGVELPGERGLLGHSDADVALHAVTDAVLGAIADGDIGSHFPPTDPRWRGARSSLFLEHALARASELGYRVVNCDLTIVGEQPKVAPVRGRLRHALAALLGVPDSAVSVKGTTTEGLGFSGRGEGLAALAVVLLEAHDG